MAFRVRLILVAASLLFSALVMEFFLRAYFYARTNYDIEMWRYALQLKQEVSDRRSHVHVPSASARLMNVNVSINSNGLRDREIPYEKPADTYRILCLGDSVTLGWGVNLDETFNRILERDFNRGGLKPGFRIETLNMGVGNYNLEQEIEAYLREGRKYHPDAVLLFYHITDAEPTQKHPSGFLAQHSYLYAFLIQRFNQLRPYLERSNNYVAFYRQLYSGDAWSRFQPVIDEVVNETKADGAKLVPVILPEIRSLERYPFREYHDVMVKAFGDRGAPAIDLRSDFEGRRSVDYLVASDDPHPNAKAHALIAEAVAREIKARHLLP